MQREYPLFALSEDKDVSGIVSMLQRENERLYEENSKLKERVDWLVRQLFGSKSEVLAQLPKQGEMGLECQDKVPDKPDQDEKKPGKKRAPKETYTVRPAKTVHIDLIPDEVDAHPELYRRIDEKSPRTCVRTELIPAQLVRYVYTLVAFVRKDDPDATPIRAKAPANLLRGSELGYSIIAQTVYNKFVQHFPCYRQLKDLSRMGLKGVEEHTLCHWIRRAAEELAPLYGLIHAHLMAASALHADETGVECLKEPQKKSYMWGIGAPQGPVLYYWSPTRGQSTLDRLLREGMDPEGVSYAGTLVTDGYSSYDAWVDKRTAEHEEDPSAPAPPKRQACWTHARRKFVEGARKSADPQFCKEMVELIAPLYKIENELRESNAPPDEVLRRRQEKSKPIIKDFFARVQARMLDTAKPPLNKLLEALQYALNRKEELCTYLDDPAVPMDNNAIERAMRPIAIGRKNYLFVGSAEGGKRAAILYTLLRECERTGVDALAWLNAVLGKVRTWQGDLHELLPGNLQLPSTH